MKRKERVKAAINHIKTEIVPYNIELTKSESKKVCGYLGIKESEFFEYAGNHIEKMTCNLPDIETKKEYFQDEFGAVWNRTLDKDIGVLDNIIFNSARMDNYRLPEIDFGKLNKSLETFVNNKKDSFKFAKINFSLFERAWSLRGFENLLMDFLLNPKFVHDLFGRITERNIAIIECALKYDIDGIYVGDDYGQQKGMIMSPNTWREFIRPYLNKMFSKIKQAGKVSCLHSCGDIELIFGDLIDIGLDIYQTVQPEVYDLKRLKREYGEDLTFFGAISTQRDMPNVTPQKLKGIVRATIEILGKEGGYIAAPTHKVPDDVNSENIVALIEVLRYQK